MIGWKLDEWPSTTTDMRRLKRNPGTQLDEETVVRKFIKKSGLPNLIKGLGYVKCNNLSFAVKFNGPVPMVPNKGEKIGGGPFLTKSVLSI